MADEIEVDSTPGTGTGAVFWTHIYGDPIWALDPQIVANPAGLEAIWQFSLDPDLSPLVLVKISTGLGELFVRGRDSDYAHLQFSFPEQMDSYLGALDAFYRGETPDAFDSFHVDGTPAANATTGDSGTLLGQMWPAKEGKDDSSPSGSDGGSGSPEPSKNNSDKDTDLIELDDTIYLDWPAPNTPHMIGENSNSGGIHIPWNDPDWTDFEHKNRFPRGPIILGAKAGTFEIVAEGAKAVNAWMASTFKTSRR